ncbi:hypothetical protein WMZ97_01505 [Lentibacillus sp. N15]
MVNKEQKNNMFKENTNNGEHRNGRKSQFKNHNSQGNGKLNEYISGKADE